MPQIFTGLTGLISPSRLYLQEIPSSGVESNPQSVVLLIRIYPFSPEEKGTGEKKIFMSHES